MRTSFPRPRRTLETFAFAACLALAAGAFAQWPHPLDLAEVGASVGGARLDGRTADSLSGVSLGGAGDVDGDGYDDFLIGADVSAPGGRPEAGEAYLIYGGPHLEAGTFDLASLDGLNGVVFEGRAADDRLGAGLGGAGDVNGDGFADILVGAYFADPGGDAEAGEGYLIYGAPGGLAHTGGVFDLESLDGTNGVRLEGVNPNDRSNFTLSGSGDVNGDGYDDFLICGYRREVGIQMDAGEAYLVYGSATGAAHVGGVLDLDSLDGTNGAILRGFQMGDLTGDAVSGAGDVNGDGYADIVINAYRATRFGRVEAGVAYVVYGAPGGVPHAAGILDLSTLDGSNGVQIVGADAGDLTGDMLSGAGDVNGDGYADILIGSRLAEGFAGEMDAGEARVLYGAASGLPNFFGTLDLASPLDPSRQTVLPGADALDWAGFAVAGAGDVNGDGFFDLLIGAPFGSPGGDVMAGEAYLIFGRPGNLASSGTLLLASVDGTNGVRLEGVDPSDSAGVHVGAAGDVNGDGLHDFMVGADMADLPGLMNAGETYLLLGQPAGTSAVYSGFAAPGDAPRLGLGLIGNGALGTPASRLRIDFADGAGPLGGPSRATAILERSDLSITGIPNAPGMTADVLWELQTDRAGWTSAEIALRYLDSEIAGLVEGDLLIYQAPAPGGPWTELSGQTLDPVRNEIRATTSQAGFFALATSPLAPAAGWDLFE